MGVVTYNANGYNVHPAVWKNLSSLDTGMLTSVVIQELAARKHSRSVSLVRTYRKQGIGRGGPTRFGEVRLGEVRLGEDARA